MSSLILPKTSFLKENMDALFARYPHERRRLEPILSASVPMQQWPNVIPPAAPSQPPIRILLLLGIVNPVFLAQLLNDPMVRRENFKTFIFENDPEFLAFVFQNADLTQIINAKRNNSFLTEWFLIESEDSAKANLFRALKPEHVTALMFNVQNLKVHNARTPEIDSYYERVQYLYDETAKHVLHNFGNIDDSLLGIDVTLRNKEFVLNSPGIDDLRNYYEGCTAIICGAGHSLDKNIETIKKYNDRFIVIAADAAVKPLIEAGIRVDFCTSIERLNSYQKPFFENLPNTGTELVAFPVVHPEVLQMFPGQVRLVYRNYSFFAYFEKAYPKGILRCGGSTSHLGLRLAAYMGCKKTILVGLDSCYEEKDGLFRSHCSGTGHPEWGQFVPLQEFNLKRRHQPPMQAVNVFGEQVTTNITYYQWIKELSEELAYIGQKMTIVNSSTGGLAIEGVPYLALEKVADSCDPVTVPKKVTTNNSITRNWDHAVLLKHFEAWLAVAKAGSAEASEILKAEKVDQSRYDALLYTYNFRMIIDDLFIAFAIQCCALEYFHMENRWWALNVGYEEDLTDKTVILRDRFDLYTSVLEKLINIFRKNT